MAPASPRQDRWHVGKEIPLALIVMLFLQTGGWVWWAATQSAKLDEIARAVGKFEMGQYTKSDAERDRALSDQRDREMERRIGSLEADRLRRGQP